MDDSDNVHALWKECLYDQSTQTNDIEYIYQYTSKSVLDCMRKNRCFRLTPACYLNDPEEGNILFSFLENNMEKHPHILQSLSTIKKYNQSHSITFIRSFTTMEDNLIMWDSGYSDNGKGVSVGISLKKLNKGFGISQTKIHKTHLDSSIFDVFDHDNLIEDTEKTPQEDSKKSLPIEASGLYKIVYVSKQSCNNLSSDENAYTILENIIQCLQKIPKKYFKQKDFLTVLSELFSPIAHLIKDESYKHENEYRLMFIGSIKDNKEYIYNDNQQGIYIETEPILF